MIAFKKIAPLFLAFFLLNIPATAQENKDIGFIISLPGNPGLAFEYRSPLNEKYRLKLGATFGTDQNHFGFGNGTIISVTDSIITERIYSSNTVTGGIRAGVERRFGSSMFSLGADVNLNYANTRKSYYNYLTFLLEDGTWGAGPFIQEFPPNAPATSRINQHFLVPGFRLSINMDIPVGKAFLINLAVTNQLNLPIYMGATNVVDPLGEFIGSPPSTIDYEGRLSVGLRYKLGARKE